MSKPKVTVITPTYNQARFIRGVIDSIQGQDYDNLEHIVINDGSTDSTPEILAQYPASNRLHIYHQSNQGEVATVNRGYRLATGDIIGLVNSDDPLLPGCISKMAEFMQQHEDVVVCYPDWIMIDEQGNKMREMRTREYDYLYMVKYHFCTPGPGTFIRRLPNADYLYRLERFGLMADFEHWWRLGLKYKFARMPEILATHRRYPTQTGYNPNKAKQRAMQHIELYRYFYNNLHHNEYLGSTYQSLQLYLDLLNTERQAKSSAYYVAAATALPVYPLAFKLILQAMIYRPAFIHEQFLPICVGKGFDYLRGKREFHSLDMVK